VKVVTLCGKQNVAFSELNNRRDPVMVVPTHTKILWVQAPPPGTDATDIDSEHSTSES